MKGRQDDPAPSKYSYAKTIMYHVYLLKSRKSGSLYIGYTNNVERRLEAHNAGNIEYTRKYLPWTLIYYESFSSLDDAKKREKSLKYFGKAYSQLKNRIATSLNKKE